MCTRTRAHERIYTEVVYAPGIPARLPHLRDLHAVQKHDVTAHEITPADDDDEEEEEEDKKGARRRNRRAA